MARCPPAKSEQGESKNNGPNEALTVATMRVCNKDRSPVAVHGCYVAPTPTGFAEIVSDDLPVLHASTATLSYAGVAFTASIVAESK
jgi:hypothetical protein